MNLTHIIENPTRIVSRKPVHDRYFLEEIVCGSRGQSPRPMGYIALCPLKGVIGSS